MQALLFDGELRLDRNHPLPERKPFEVLIRVLSAGICRTDVEVVKGYLDFQGILGHEFVGVVEESPDPNLVGKRVVGEINISCGKCIYCLKGMSTHCENRSTLGIQNKNGVFAEFVSLPLENVHPLPEKVSNDQAIFVEPLAASLQILAQVHITPADQVIVLGDGNLGLLCAQVLAMTGAQVLAVGRHEEKLDIVRNLGIRTCLIDELSREKVDFVIECTGSPSGLEEAFKLIHPRGTIVLKSTFFVQPKLDLAPLVINEINLIGSRCGPFFPAIRLLEAHGATVEPLISDRFDLKDGIKALQAAKRKDTLKIVLDIGQ
ncbi:MAG TPA: alcohol dehydrogenase catalytic domain-containing protein [Thermodesulfobacteriota bacterium]|nr:alcohol dehydrogenase catalytic domain-containing protein [Deltaproteobacteria bacterium]HNR11904.1 alcohol dehydrogenase catalytic domain-containing protein [Thermodesulfobacteriota bacterium]HNU70427.1 alcohol dehydrogenase catalytic domain-containing protein [Thermodesulfobacteriota bacterium]